MMPNVLEIPSRKKKNVLVCIILLTSVSHTYTAWPGLMEDRMQLVSRVSIPKWRQFGRAKGLKCLHANFSSDVLLLWLLNATYCLSPIMFNSVDTILTGNRGADRSLR